jgi:hypothetical protein
VVGAVVGAVVKDLPQKSSGIIIIEAGDGLPANVRTLVSFNVIGNVAPGAPYIS